MLQVRDVPDDVHRELVLRAAREGVSLSRFVLTRLERLTERPPVDVVLARAAARGGRLSASEAVDAIRAAREARDEELMRRAAGGTDT
ncbi:MAG: FitA-like ribbon-helix-helix domain-containing protein [Actinomycetes bacterium]